MTDSFSEAAAKRKLKYHARYTAADAFGRIITVMRLTPSQQLTVQGFCTDLTGTTTVITNIETGATTEMPRDMPLMLAAAVRDVDDKPYSFPKSRGELNGTLDMLDEEGLAAVVEALGKANAVEPKIDVLGEAKN